jgi:hypothetical protein
VERIVDVGDDLDAALLLVAKGAEEGDLPFVMTRMHPGRGSAFCTFSLLGSIWHALNAWPVGDGVFMYNEKR